MSLCAFQTMFQFMKFCVYWCEYNLGFAKGGRTFSVPEEHLKWMPSPQIILPVSACKHSQWHEHSTMLPQKHPEATNAQNRVPNLFARECAPIFLLNAIRVARINVSDRIKLMPEADYMQHKLVST